MCRQISPRYVAEAGLCISCKPGRDDTRDGAGGINDWSAGDGATASDCTPSCRTFQKNRRRRVTRISLNEMSLPPPLAETDADIAKLIKIPTASRLRLASRVDHDLPPSYVPRLGYIPKK